MNGQKSLKDMTDLELVQATASQYQMIIQSQSNLTAIDMEVNLRNEQKKAEDAVPRTQTE